jgi:NDP-sugar pyrophosphorylase family protein
MSEPVATAVILAGGLGTRIRQLHPETPKPLIPIGGKPFLVWQLEWLRAQGISRVVLAIGYRAEQIAAYFATPRVTGLAVCCVQEQTPLGTGGAMRFAAQAVTEEWCLVCNGDSLCPADVTPLWSDAMQHHCEAALLVARVADVRDCGSVVVDTDGRVRGFVEKGAAQGAGLVNAGVYCVRTAWARTLPDRTPLSNERDVFPHMTDGRLRGVITTTPFLDIGVPERLAQAEAFLHAHRFNPHTATS